MEPEPSADGWLTLLFQGAQIASSSGVGFGLLLLLLLLVCSALISGSEVAFFSLTANDFEKLDKNKTTVNQRILLLKDKPRRLLATILVANNFINIAIVILSDFLLRQLLPEALLGSWSQSILDFLHIGFYFSIEQATRILTFLITIVGVTFLLVLFGEVAPKIYANINNLRMAQFMATPLNLLMRLFSPLTGILVGWTNLIERRLEKRTNEGPGTSREDIDEAIELTVSREKGGRQEVDILKRIVQFGDVTVKQIMRSRVDVVAVDFRISFQELLRTIRQSEYSRIPVYDTDFDNVTGILYAKDLLGHMHDPKFEWQQLIRTNMLYVPESKRINDLLKAFQTQRLHMAIVVDEYGGSQGIVTLEDILEEVIGDIKDEFDNEPEVVYKKIDDYTYLFEGKTLINDVCRITGLDTKIFDAVRGDADSIAGLLLEVMGQIPRPETELNFNQFKFKVISVSKRRIEQVQITLPK